MRLEKIEIQNCRNIQSLSLAPHPELTVITGQNGQGKTNLLECIWLLTGGKSFRGARDLQLVRQGEEFGRIVGNVHHEGQFREIKILIHGQGSAKKGRYGSVNQVDYGRAAALAGIFTAVVFEPDHLRLVKGSPEGRRRFIDAAMCQLYPGYVGTLRRFQRALFQKNALLKSYAFTQNAELLLDAFNGEIAQYGAEISTRRQDYLARCIPRAQGYYQQLSRGREELEILFRPCCKEGELAALLESGKANDIRAGYSTLGPQREDMEILVNGKSARLFGSQGQQRSAVLAVKLAEAACAEEVCGEHPVMLLDDVLSELDETRQEFLLGKIQGKQCFVSTCDPSAFGRTGGMVVQVRGGAICEG